MLEQANLFIMPLDEERRWYRYHHLFADLLRQRLRQTHPQLIPILHRRAGRWFAQNGFMDEAIDEALLAGDFPQAAQLIARVAEGTWKRGDDSKLRRWLERLPADQVYSKPQFCVYLAWCLLADGELDEAQKALQAAGRALEKMAQAENQPAGQNLQTIQGKIAAAHAFAAFYRGEFADLFHYAGQALDYLPQHDLAWRSTATHLLGDAYDFQGDMLRAYQSRVEAVEVSKTSGNSYVSMIANLKLAIILRRQGKLHEALEICRQQMALATESRMAQTVLVGWLFAIWGEVLAESNDLEGARRKAKMSAERLEHDGDLAMIGSSYLGLIRIMFSCDDLPAAEAFIHKIERLDHGSDVPPWISSLAASWQARIWLAQGKQDLALRWAAERPLDAAEELTYVRETECVDIARLLIAQGRLAEANGLLERLLGPARSYGRTWHVIEILMLQALAHQAAGDTDRALAALEQALVAAEPGGITRTFIDEGPPMASLLHAANARGIMPAYVEKLLQAFSAPPQQAAISQTTSDIGHPTPGIIDSLSDRELEVLQLIAQGLTNSQIAARLYLSLNTVKAHTRSIYSKLDVHNRTQAVARARALHLLPP